jgi:hypothetical protein
MARAADRVRFVYRWALSAWGKRYEAWQNSLPKLNKMALRRELNRIGRQMFSQFQDLLVLRAQTGKLVPRQAAVDEHI